MFCSSYSAVICPVKISVIIRRAFRLSGRSLFDFSLIKYGMITLSRETLSINYSVFEKCLGLALKQQPPWEMVSWNAFRVVFPSYIKCMGRNISSVITKFLSTVTAVLILILAMISLLTGTYFNGVWPLSWW